MDSTIHLLNNWRHYYSRLALSWTFWRNKKVQAIGSSKWITANKEIGKWDMERMQVSCTPHFKGSNRYFDVSKKELSNKAWVLYRDGHFIWMELTKNRVTKNTRVLTIYMGNPGNFGWKIKRFTPSRLGRLQKNRLCFDAMQFFNSFWSVQLTWIYFVASRSISLHVKFYIFMFMHKSFTPDGLSKR